jgi:hypothetical protein
MKKWTHEGREYRVTEEQAVVCRVRVIERVLARQDGGDTGWLELARWRAAEDGPTFGGLANVMLSAVPA